MRRAGKSINAVLRLHDPARFEVYAYLLVAVCVYAHALACVRACVRVYAWERACVR